MKKLKIEIPILLPSVPNEKDRCVDRLIDNLKSEKGIEDAHIEEGKTALICIHYHPDTISISKVKK